VNRYDPNNAPDPEVWLALDEQIRIALVEEHHRLAHIKLPNLETHAVFHAIIENQIAQNLDSVVRAMTRLTAEGLSRHDAVHAIASVLAVHIHDLFNTKEDAANSQAIYDAAIERLSAKVWRGGEL
jgi:Tfp pilus assembly PilM family ATPase